MSRRVTRLLVLLVLLTAVIISWRVRRVPTATRLSSATNQAEAEVVKRFLALEAREREAEQTVWAKEILAQECGRVFESLWDSLNAATNRPSNSVTFAPVTNTRRGAMHVAPSLSRNPNTSAC